MTGKLNYFFELHRFLSNPEGDKIPQIVKIFGSARADVPKLRLTTLMFDLHETLIMNNMTAVKRA